MLYTLVKILVRAGLLLFCRRVVFSNNAILQQQGPLLLACNHPNSFFDAVLLGAFFKHPVHFLARGDAFKKSFARRVLEALKAIPIYRLREGREYLALNDATFEQCTSILRAGGIVLIFAEGLCLNQWQMRPLKKGAARIALNVWKHEEVASQFSILPVSFNYSTFTAFTKNVFVQFGELITHKAIPAGNDAEQMHELNRIMFARLFAGMLTEEHTCGVIPFLLTNMGNGSKPNGIARLKQQQANLHQLPVSALEQLSTPPVLLVNKQWLYSAVLGAILLFVPALVALAIHLPLYIPLKRWLKKKTEGTVFYHSASFAVLIVVYPFYCLLLAVVMVIVFESWSGSLLLLVLPLLAKLALIWLHLITGLKNALRLPRHSLQALQAILLSKN